MKLLISLVVVLSAVAAAADSRLEMGSFYGGLESAPMISNAHPEIVIINREAGPVFFLLRLGDDDWVEERIDGGAGKTFGCRRCEKDDFEIKVRTNDFVARYDLESGRRYSISYDTNRRVWNVFSEGR